MDLKLENLGLGVVAEKFDDELVKVVNNIVDQNTDPKTMRDITIKLKIKPDQENRELCDLEVVVSSKLAPTRSHVSKLNVGINPLTGEINAAELIQQQGNLFPAETHDNVVKMEASN